MGSNQFYIKIHFLNPFIYFLRDQKILGRDTTVCIDTDWRKDSFQNFHLVLYITNNDVKSEQWYGCCELKKILVHQTRSLKIESNVHIILLVHGPG